MSLNPNCLQGYDFLDKFIPMYEALISAGFTKRQALKAMCSQDFVQDFVDTPEWFIEVNKLPKERKWSEGKRYSLKAGKKNGGETYTFLIIEDDLYIKDFFKSDAVFISDDDGAHFYRPPADYAKRICVIKQWKSLNLNAVNIKLGRTSFFQNCLLDFGYKNGGKIGFTQPLLKDFRGEP